MRCECGHSGDGLESPWSAIKIFNTPDFDPSTGIYTPPAGQEEHSESKLLADDSFDIQLYPNPNDGNFRIVFDTEVQLNEVLLSLRDIQGKLIEQRSVQLGKANSDILWDSQRDLEKGVYLMDISSDRFRSTIRVMIDN